MDKVEEVLPGIEKFLCQILSKEKLSSLAQKQRQYYIERIEVLRDLPEKAPSRPSSTVKGSAVNGSLSQSFIEQERLKAWRGLPGEEEEDQRIYDDLDDQRVEARTNAAVDDIYENPVNNHDNGAVSDGGLSGPYDSWDNDTFDEDEETTEPDIQLPKSKSKKRKTKNTTSAKDQPISSLASVAWKGTLSLKTFLTWSKRYCFINDGILLCYKNESDTRPVINVPLQGYQVTYNEKQNNQQLRLSKQGSDTYYFNAETRELAQIWLKYLNAAALGNDNVSQCSADNGTMKYENVDLKEEVTELTVAPPVSPNQMSCNVSASMSSSEGGSADGSIGPPVSPVQDAQDKRKTKTLSGRIMDTFRSKKVEKKRPTLEALGIDTSQISISGHLEVLCTFAGSKKWTGRWCMIKRGVLEILRDSSDKIVEMSISLAGCELKSANDAKRKLALKLLCQKEEKLVLDFSDLLEQGSWLGVLMKEIEGKSSEARSPDNDITVGEGVSTDAHNDPKQDNGEVNQPAKRISASFLHTNVQVIKPKCRREELPPPPLPMTAPPEPCPLEDDYLDYNPYPKEETASPFSKRKETKPTTASPVLSRIRDKKEDISQRTSPVSKVKGHPAAGVITVEAEEDVIKCSTGPTITQDIDILEKFESPVLSKLRKERAGSDPPDHSSRVRKTRADSEASSDGDFSEPIVSRRRKVRGAATGDMTDDERISDLQKKLADLKSQRVIVKGRKLVARTASMKSKYAVELADIEQKYADTEAELEGLERDKKKSKAVIGDALGKSYDFGAKTGSLRSTASSRTSLSSVNKSVTLPVGSKLDSSTNIKTKASARYSSGDLLRSDSSDRKRSTESVTTAKSVSKTKSPGEKDVRYPSIVSQNFTTRSQGSASDKHKSTSNTKISPTLNSMASKVGDIGKIFEEPKATKSVTPKVSSSESSSKTGATDVTKAVRAAAKSPRGDRPNPSTRITSVSDRLKKWESIGGTKGEDGAG